MTDETTSSAPPAEQEERKPRRRRRKPKPKPAPAEATQAAHEQAADVTEVAGAAQDAEEAPAAKPKPRGRRKRRTAEVETTEPREEFDYAGQVEAWRKQSEEALVPLKIAEALISNDALRIVEKLNELGHLSYVVGGCVRDLALGTEPKDFDVVTTARPQQVRRAFRYARIIGRRFRLVHVRFGRDRMIEVATFRAQVPEVEAGDDLLVREDNIYGSPVEDAQRRDFTVNGLFYDPISGSVVDHVDGIKDLKRKIIRSIGPADNRIQEDPVRILRALRFAAKLGFEIDKKLESAIRKHGADILRCSPPRLWEEMLKILRSGHSAQAFAKAQKLGFLEHILPEVSAAMSERSGEHKALLEALDALVIERGQAPDDLILLAAVVLPLVSSENPRQQIDQLMREWNDRFRVPRRLRERLEDGILGARAMVPKGPWVDKEALARRALFGDAIEILDLVTRATGTGRALVKDWRLMQQPEDEEQDA